MSEADSTNIIREAGLKATRSRVAVLRALERAQNPIGIVKLENALPQINRATLYRILQTFVQHGLAETCDIGHKHVDYRLSGKQHVHYVVCDKCGKTLTIAADCYRNHLNNLIKSQAPGFSVITRHSTTFFGYCNKCAGT